MPDRNHEAFAARTGYRIAGGVLGLALLAAGGYVLSLPLDAARALGAALLLLFGANQLLAAWRGRMSWLGRIGPLP